MVLQAPSERTHLLYGASGNFAYVNHSTGPITAPFRWTSGKRGSPSSLNWPPKGIQLVVNFRTAQTTEHRDFLLTVTYELYDGAPVLSKRVSLSYAPTDNSRTTVHRTPLHSPSPKTYRRLRTGKPPSKQTDIEGWDAPVNGVLAFVSAKRGLCLNNTAGTGNEVAQTVYGQHETSVSLSIAGCVPEVHPTAWCATPPTPAISSMRDDIHGGVVLGFTSKKGQLVSALALDELDYWMQWTFSNDGRVTMGQGNSTPSHVGQANDVGDRLSLSLEGSRFAGFVNGVAMGWLAAGSTSGLRPVVQVLSYGEHHNPYPNACNLKPTTDSPSPSPTPPSPHPSPAPTPTPPTSSAVVNQVVVDLLAANAGAGHYLTHGSRPPEWNYNDGGTGSGALPSLLQASSDQSFGAACRWRDQMPQSVDHIPGCAGCSDEGAVEPYLNCSYTSPPGVTVDGTSSFQSFKAIETAMDSFDPTRQVLTRARVGEILTPWTLENPLTFRTSGKNFTAAVDQMAEVGFELLGFNFQTSQIEDLNPENTAAIKAKVDYAKSKGIEVGGYDLIVLDRSTFTDSSGKVVPLPQNMSTQPRGSACMASAWFEYISSTLHQFIDATGLSMLDTDGAYSGEKCSATNHSHHHNEADSVHMQTKYQGIFYNKMREKGVYLASANNYFYQGSQVTGMGYNEQQFSLPRWRDLTVSRQTMYDDLYSLRPTQGHMLIPLTDYHAGASAAAFVGHAHAYEWALAQYFGAGLTNTQVSRHWVLGWSVWVEVGHGLLMEPLIPNVIVCVIIYVWAPYQRYNKSSICDCRPWIWIHAPTLPKTLRRLPHCRLGATRSTWMHPRTMSFANGHRSLSGTGKPSSSRSCTSDAPPGNRGTGFCTLTPGLQLAIMRATEAGLKWV